MSVWNRTIANIAWISDTTALAAAFHPIAGAGVRFLPPHVGLRKSC